MKPKLCKSNNLAGDSIAYVIWALIVIDCFTGLQTLSFENLCPVQYVLSEDNRVTVSGFHIHTFPLSQLLPLKALKVVTLLQGQTLK